MYLLALGPVLLPEMTDFRTLSYTPTRLVKSLPFHIAEA